MTKPNVSVFTFIAFGSVAESLVFVMAVRDPEMVVFRIPAESVTHLNEKS